jgi:NAD-dependent dihydropyrimidine dehydrogenase PreA subunit
MQREIIRIDEEKCNGCGLCIPNCYEGALQIIDNKAVLVSDLMCDGLGACIGHCPEDALSIEKREAQPYDEVQVMKEMIPKGRNVVIAHLKHLKEHGENEYLDQGKNYLLENRQMISFDTDKIIAEVNASRGSGHINEKRTIIENPVLTNQTTMPGGCPGSRSFSFNNGMEKFEDNKVSDQPSALRQWPVQLHLINPRANYFQNSDLLISADCVAYSMGNFHSKYLRNKSLIIACPKLDSNQEIYYQKLKTLINESGINTISVMIMEVPCCGGLLGMVQSVVAESARKIPVKRVVVGIRGEILQEDWV